MPNIPFKLEYPIARTIAKRTKYSLVEVLEYFRDTGSIDSALYNMELDERTVDADQGKPITEKEYVDSFVRAWSSVEKRIK